MISTSLVAIAIQKRFTIDDILTLRPLVVSQEKTEIIHKKSAIVFFTVIHICICIR